MDRFYEFTLADVDVLCPRLYIDPPVGSTVAVIHLTSYYENNYNSATTLSFNILAVVLLVWPADLSKKTSNPSTSQDSKSELPAGSYVAVY